MIFSPGKSRFTCEELFSHPFVKFYADPAMKLKQMAEESVGKAILCRCWAAGAQPGRGGDAVLCAGWECLCAGLHTAQCRASLKLHLTPLSRVCPLLSAWLSSG